MIYVFEIVVLKLEHPLVAGIGRKFSGIKGAYKCVENSNGRQKV